MKYLIVSLLLLLTSCAKTPGQVEGKVVEIYSNWHGNYIKVYNEKDGIITVLDSPYFNSIKYNKKVLLACNNIKGFFAFDDCYIIGMEK
jgi:hypothetical protein